MIVEKIPSAWRLHVQPVLALALLGWVANAVSLSGLFNPDPEMSFIGLRQGIRGGWVPGPQGWLDPTVAMLTQPLGHLVMWDWLHGIVPWWNPYSGVGMPLVAEMQTSAFFLPFVGLLSFHCGWLLLRATLQSLCGIFTYALLTELGMSRSAAFLGGAFYALCPEFYLNPHAAIAPMPFLPLALLGVEQALRAARAARPMGWSMLVLGTAYSILGGFPEVTYFDGLLVGVWALWRLAGLGGTARWRFAAKLALGGGIGLALTAPLMVPFLEYLRYADLGAHQGNLFATLRLPAVLRPLLIFPYLYGIFDQQPPASLVPLFMGDASNVRMPGWVGLPVLALVLAALTRRGGAQRGLRWLLFGWLVLWLARYVGVPPVVWLFDYVPGMATADSTRFSGPMVNFTLYVLAAFGLDDYRRLGPLPRRVLGLVLLCLAAILAAVLLPVAGVLHSWYSLMPGSFRVLLPGLTCAFGVTAWLCRELRCRRQGFALSAALIMLPLGHFLIPQFAGVREGNIDRAPIRFMQAHIGTDRMISLGAFDVASPAEFGVASIDYIGMPAPKLWTDYITAHLRTFTDLNVYRGADPTAREALLDYMPDYEELGIRYVVTLPDDGLYFYQRPTAPPGSAGPFDQLVPLNPGGPDYTATINAPPGTRSIGSMSVVLATYAGYSRGPLTASLCAGAQCGMATADPQTMPTDGALQFDFSHPLALPPGPVALTLRLSHPGGNIVGVWLRHQNGMELPLVSFAPPGPSLPLLFRDNVAAIYALPNPAPYMQSSGNACRLAIHSRQSVTALCAGPAVLLRREMYYPGWSARINGHNVAVTQAGLFQSVAIPPGPSWVKFSYTPTHIRPACALFILAAVLWAGCFWRARRWC